MGFDITKFNDTLNAWFFEMCDKVVNGLTMIIIEGVTVGVCAYCVYCAVRIMCTPKDEIFNEYMNKTIIAGTVYFCAKCVAKLLVRG